MNGMSMRLTRKPGVSLAVTTVLSTFQRLVIATAAAVASASAILVGRAIGANEPDRAADAAAQSVRVALGLGLTLALALLLGRDDLLGLFGAIDTATLLLARYNGRP